MANLKTRTGFWKVPGFDLDRTKIITGLQGVLLSDELDYVQ